MPSISLAESAAPFRIAVSAPVLVALALALTLVAPLWLVLLAPILFGVPHVLGDLRCLVLARPGGLDGRTLLIVLAPLAAMTGLRLLALCGLGSAPGLEIACGVLAVAGAVHAGSAVGPTRVRRTLAVLTLGALLCVQPAWTTLALAHLHNLVALGFFVAWAKDRHGARTTLAVFACALAALCAFAPTVAAENRAATLTWSSLQRSLAPGLAEPLASRVVLAFAFAQAVHYALWVVLLPRELGLRTTTLVRELGKPGLALAVLATLCVPALALLDAASTRATYLSLVVCHGWLELAVAGWLLARRFPGCRTSSPG